MWGYNERTDNDEPLRTSHGGIVYTTNRGQTWQRATVPSTDQAYYSIQRLRSGTLLAVSVDVAILRDSVPQISDVRCYSGNILRSMDNGITWASQATFTHRYQDLSLCTYRIWEGNDRIYAATPEAVMISNDGGVSFTAATDFPFYCSIHSVAEFKGRLFVATSLGVYAQDQTTSVAQGDRAQHVPIAARASRSGQTWRVTVSGLPMPGIEGIDIVDLQGRQYQTNDLWSGNDAASITSPLPSSGVYGVVVRGKQGQRWTTVVSVIE